MYSARMSRFLNSIAATACICLLAMQMSGMHLHVDLDGDDAGIHVAHLPHIAQVHQSSPHGHDHSAEMDVALLEQVGFNWSQLVPLIFACAIGVALIACMPRRFTFAPQQTSKVRHRYRWRPPLRAPPISA